MSFRSGSCPVHVPNETRFPYLYGLGLYPRGLDHCAGSIFAGYSCPVCVSVLVVVVSVTKET